jgi:hypothetical protein
MLFAGYRKRFCVAVMREGGMTPELARVFIRHKFAEHRAKLDLVHLMA